MFIVRPNIRATRRYADQIMVHETTIQSAGECAPIYAQGRLIFIFCYIRRMTMTDWVGAIGVSILLAAFFLNVTKRVNQDSLIYISLNLSGALIALVASYMLHYMPFIVLEAVWSLVSVIALINYFRKGDIVR